MPGNSESHSCQLVPCAYHGSTSSTSNKMAIDDTILAFTPACAKPQGQPEVRAEGLLTSFPSTCRALGMSTALCVEGSFQIPRNMWEFYKVSYGRLITPLQLFIFSVSLFVCSQLLPTASGRCDGQQSTVIIFSKCPQRKGCLHPASSESGQI